jgi:hypothetical protein
MQHTDRGMLENILNCAAYTPSPRLEVNLLDMQFKQTAILIHSAMFSICDLWMSYGVNIKQILRSLVLVVFLLFPLPSISCSLFSFFSIHSFSKGSISLTCSSVKITIFWDVTPRSLLPYRRFERAASISPKM